MPVAARESSVYMGVTIAEYYRQMGVDCLLLADSTSRWAQALREMSGRLEEIPGEEAFPAYLASRIAELYERAGVLKLYDGTEGSLTIGGSVSPAGGNFEEPVTLATLSVVGCFLGLSRQRSDARRYPAIDPLISWSKYSDRFEENGDEAEKHRIDIIRKAQKIVFESDEIGKKMSVVGEEGTSLVDMVTYLKGEFYDAVFLQQNAFDSVDTATDLTRQNEQLEVVDKVLSRKFSFEDHEKAREFFLELTDKVVQLNYLSKDVSIYEDDRNEILNMIEGM
jgi:V/A-type H+-transporting ATPase subunit A